MYQQLPLLYLHKTARDELHCTSMAKEGAVFSDIESVGLSDGFLSADFRPPGFVAGFTGGIAIPPVN